MNEFSLLLVEDDACDAELTRAMLPDQRITWVQRLEPALTALEQAGFDAILLDLTLPEGQGLDVFLEIEARAGDIPIVVLTGLADAALALETVRRGAQDYLVKHEIEGHALERAVQHAVERKRLRFEGARLKREAADMQRRKSEFVAMVSHELRNPMTGIVGFVQLLARTPMDALQREYVDAISQSTRSLVDLLNNLLDLSRADAGQVSLESEPFSLRELLETVASHSLPQIRPKGLELVCSVDPLLPDQVLGDALRLRQVVVNLLGNAIKFTQQGYVGISARLRVTTASEVVVRFVVEDSGRGIPEDKRSAIFQAFTQTQSDDRKGGAGLGLAIAQQIIAGMGGVLGVESALGCGTAFWFDLHFPIHQPSSLGGTLDGRRVLVAELHGPSCEAMVFMCRRLGASVQSVRSEVDFALMVQSETWDLVLVCPDLWPLARGLEGPCWLVPAYSRDAVRDARAVHVARPVRLADLRLHPRPLLTPAVAQVATARQTGRVLVVDDEPGCRALVEAVAQQCQLESVGVESGAAALEQLSLHSFDLILLDGQLPDCEGRELAREIRRRLSLPRPLIVSMSGRRQEVDFVDFDGAMLKPIAPEMLEEWFRLPRYPVSVDWSVLERFRKYQKAGNENLICDLIQSFTQSAAQRAEALCLASHRGSEQDTRRAAHVLKGAAASVGAVAVAALAERIEESPGRTHWVAGLRRELDRSLGEFADYLKEATAHA